MRRNQNPSERRSADMPLHARLATASRQSGGVEQSAADSVVGAARR